MGEKGWEMAWHTVGQDIETLLALHEVFGGLFDSGQIGEIDVQEFQAAVRAGMRLSDFFNRRVGFGLRAAG